MGATSTTTHAGYEAVTAGCGLRDRSQRGKLALTGPAAAELLDGQLSNDVPALVPGAGLYATFLTPKGKMLGDVRVLHAGEELHLDTERVSLQALFNLLHRGRVGFDAQLHKRTLEEAQLSLLGPGARDVAGVELPAAEHSNARAQVGEVAVLAAVTDTGVDLFCAAEQGGRLAATLRERGAAEIDEPTAEIVRVERGRPRYGVDLDDGVIPQEAGLNERAVSFTKGCYVGQETVARLHYRGRPNRHLRGLMLDGPAQPGTPLHSGEREVGRLGSVVESPRLGAIALALVRRQVEPGDEVELGEPGSGFRARVVELPFGEGGEEAS